MVFNSSQLHQLQPNELPHYIRYGFYSKERSKRKKKHK